MLISEGKRAKKSNHKYYKSSDLLDQIGGFFTSDNKITGHPNLSPVSASFS